MAATMNLGVFPWGMMALYPALIAPAELPSVLTGSTKRHSTKG